MRTITTSRSRSLLYDPITHLYYFLFLFPSLGMWPMFARQRISIRRAFAILCYWLFQLLFSVLLVIVVVLFLAGICNSRVVTARFGMHGHLRCQDYSWPVWYDCHGHDCPGLDGQLHGGWRCDHYHAIQCFCMDPIHYRMGIYGWDLLLLGTWLLLLH
jgi:hypothetical protein